MIIIIGKRVGSDVHLVNKHFTVFDLGVSIFQMGLAEPQGLDFGSLKHHSGFKFILNKVVKAGFTVIGYDFDMLGGQMLKRLSF